MREKQYELSWCDFLALGQVLTNRLAAERPHEFGGCSLGLVKYFTATILDNMPQDSGGIERKYLWLDALHHHTRGRVEIIHGTFRPRKHRFYIERAELDNLARCGIPINWDRLTVGPATFHPQLRIHEEKQTDVMLGCSLVTDAAMGRAGTPAGSVIQGAPQYRSNTRPTPSSCHAAIVVSADIDFLPAAQMASTVFGCPVAIAFTFPHTGYKLTDFTPTSAHHVFTVDVAEDELRSSMLPREVVLPRPSNRAAKNKEIPL